MTATIDLTRTHSMPIEVARTRAEQLAREMETRLGMLWRWEGNTLVFETPTGIARGTSGVVEVNGIDVRVQITLPKLFRPLTRTVEQRVAGKLEAFLCAN